jgi:hypothetical protein
LASFCPILSEKQPILTHFLPVFLALHSPPFAYCASDRVEGFRHPLIGSILRLLALSAEFAIETSGLHSIASPAARNRTLFLEVLYCSDLAVLSG